ncbi:MAG: hypothetical protein DCC52_11770 [Chloroflexi bacterium]|nr:MAG: hypothetical protein DCC52_11770 [Chloroflexota bacterium]
MSDYADLELILTRWDKESYRVELRYSQPGSEADTRLDAPATARLDRVALRALELQPDAYGKALGASLFGDAQIKTMFAQARASAQAQNLDLRLRLSIDPTAAELHELHWETLRDPSDNSSLVTSERILFTRYLAAQDFRPVKIKPQKDLRALVFISNPTNLGDLDGFAPIDAAGELERAQKALGNLTVTTLAPHEFATLNRLVEKLRDDIDILYLVAHGAAGATESVIFLQDDTGKLHDVAASALVTRLNELQDPPRLVVLAACQSANMAAATDNDRALASLGPRLASAGVPAVIAMQGNITMQTVAQFMPVFFRELSRDGQIDRAMAAARAAVRDNADAWMPVLFLRLRSALAARWAKKYSFPLAPYAAEDLPEVAQYIAVDQARFLVHDELEQALKQELERRFGLQLAPALQNAPLTELVHAVGALTRQNAHDPYAVLAHLPFPVYITTNPDSLIIDALQAAGKEPQVELCQWNDNITTQALAQTASSFVPDEKHPLVYCLFGQYGDPDSQVITEDDYFDYLIGVTSNKDLIHHEVKRMLTDSALLFLGFQLDDWNFRVLYRSIMSQEGGNRRKNLPHIAAQIDPAEGRLIEPERARKYLENYFGNADISIYWGSAEDFIKDLEKQGGNQ